MQAPRVGTRQVKVAAACTQNTRDHHYRTRTNNDHLMKIYTSLMHTERGTCRNYLKLFRFRRLHAR